MQNKLKPCPFCGSADIRVITTPDQCVVCCGNCHASMSRLNFMVCTSIAETLRDAHPKAVRAWNRRTSEIVNVETIFFDKEEIHENCTVQVLTNTATGDVSVGWWENEN